MSLILINQKFCTPKKERIIQQCTLIIPFELYKTEDNQFVLINVIVGFVRENAWRVNTDSSN